MHTIRCRRLVFLALALLGATIPACAADPPQQAPSAESTAVEPVPMPVTTPVEEPSRIGRLPLLRGPSDQGTCRSTGTVMEPRYAYEGEEFPKRVIYVGEGASTRSFLPTFLEIRVTQMAGGGIDETETLYVLFGPDGKIESGARQYYSTAAPPVRENGGMLPSDSSAVQGLALFVLNKCRQPASPT